MDAVFEQDTRKINLDMTSFEKSGTVNGYGGLAQLGERTLHRGDVAGSSPVASTFFVPSSMHMHEIVCHACFPSVIIKTEEHSCMSRGDHNMATGKFVIKATKTGVKFNLKASNGEIILSSQVYKAESYCRNGIASVVKNAPAAAIEDQTLEGFARQKCPKFEIYTDKAGESRFRLKAVNGQIIGVSEGYKSLKTCQNGIASVVKNAAEAPIVKEEE